MAKGEDLMVEDVLVVEDYVLLKDEQPNADAYIRDEYLADFPLD